MKPWLYPNVVQRLLIACRSYLAGELSLPGFQGEVRLAEEQIVAIEERDLKAHLFAAENRIEELIYTMEEDLRNTEARGIAHHLVETLTRDS